jgi:hypothetical protein
MSVPGISSGISVTSSPRSREKTVNRATTGHKRNLGEISREAVKPVNHFIFLTDNWPDGPVGDQSAIRKPALVARWPAGWVKGA